MLRAKSLRKQREKQDRYVARMQAQRHPCPCCGIPLSQVEAEQVAGDIHRCPRCEGTITLVVPAFDPLRVWHWGSVPG